MDYLKHKLPVLTRVLIFFLVFHGAGYAGDKIRFRVSDSMPATSPLGKLASDWAGTIDRESNGNIEVLMYPGSQLFSPEQQINAVARSYINGAFIHFDYWGRTLPALSVISKPFVFSDRERMSAFRNSQLRSYLEERIEKKGMKVLAWLVMGKLIGISTADTPVIKPGDFIHKKIRGAGPLVNSMLRAVGASPVSLGGAEVYQALQTGMIDGSLTTLSSIYIRRFYDVNDWVTVTPLFPAYIMITANMDWWRSLNAGNRKIISRASLDAEQQALRVTEKMEADMPRLLREKGMKVYFLDDGEIDVLRMLMEPAWTETFLELTGAEGKEILRVTNSR